MLPSQNNLKNFDRASDRVVGLRDQITRQRITEMLPPPNSLTVIVKGAIGSGKTTLAAEVALALKQRGITVNWQDIDMPTPEAVVCRSNHREAFQHLQRLPVTVQTHQKARQPDRDMDAGVDCDKHPAPTVLMQKEDVWTRVVVESPYAGKHGASCRCDDCQIDLAANLKYARGALRDCLQRREAPFASHLLYTQDGVLDDHIPKDRNLGIGAGFIYRKGSNLSAFYVDRGISTGMGFGLEDVQTIAQSFELRSMLEIDPNQVAMPLRDSAGVVVSVPDYQPSEVLARISVLNLRQGAEVRLASGKRIHMPVTPGLGSKHLVLKELIEDVLEVHPADLAATTGQPVDSFNRQGKPTFRNTQWTLITVERPDLGGFRMGLVPGTPDQIEVE